MAEVTQKICDGCGVAGKKGEPSYKMEFSLFNGTDGSVTKSFDVHLSASCVKSLTRKIGAESESLLAEVVNGFEKA